MFVKICGITSEEDALLAVAMGADAVGFIFAPSSRQIAPVRAGDIAKRLPPEVLTVGVFRDASPARVIDITHKAGLKAVQLHGAETVDQVHEVRASIPYVIKAFPAGSSKLKKLDDYWCDAVLVDSPTPGSGETFDWSLAKQAAYRSPRMILAGGLNPDNVAEAIATVRPWGVDVASGVESSPGNKDPRLIRAFIANAHRAFAEVEYANAPPEHDNQSPYDWQEDD